MKRSETLVTHTLLGIARQREGFDPEGCQLVIEQMDTTLLLHQAVHRALVPFGLSELQFGVLLALFSLDPEPASPADLALHTAVTRQAITEALDHLESNKLIERARDPIDRRGVRVRLTDAGGTLVEPAALKVLETFSAITRRLDGPTRQILLSGCTLLQEGAASFSPQPPLS